MDERAKKFYLKSFRQDRQSSYYVIANIIMEMFAPESVIDFGCGLGWILYYLSKHFQLQDLMGIDPSKDIQHFMKEEVNEYIYPCTLTQYLDLERKFDIAISFEVVEHFEKKYADIAITNICRHSDNIMFSAAQPGQSVLGHGARWDHVNEQPKSYWIKKFQNNGFEYNNEKTVTVVETMRRYQCKPWYILNTMVFTKKEKEK